jgi:hypothetical protein
VFVVDGRLVTVATYRINFNYQKENCSSPTRGDFDIVVAVVSFVCIFLTTGVVRYVVCVGNLS